MKTYLTSKLKRDGILTASHEEIMKHIIFVLSEKNPEKNLEDITNDITDIKKISERDNRIFAAGKLFAEYGHHGFNFHELNMLSAGLGKSYSNICSGFLPRYKVERNDFKKENPQYEKNSPPLMHFFRVVTGNYKGNLSEAPKEVIGSSSDFLRSIRLPVGKEELLKPKTQYFLGYILGNSSIQDKTEAYATCVNLKFKEHGKMLSKIGKDVFNIDLKLAIRNCESKTVIIRNKESDFSKHEKYFLFFNSRAIITYLIEVLGFRKNTSDLNLEVTDYFLRGIMDSKGAINHGLHVFSLTARENQEKNVKKAFEERNIIIEPEKNIFRIPTKITKKINGLKLDFFSSPH